MLKQELCLSDASIITTRSLFKRYEPRVMRCSDCTKTINVNCWSEITWCVNYNHTCLPLKFVQITLNAYELFAYRFSFALSLDFEIE